MGLFLGREARSAERRSVFPEPPIPPFLGADWSGNVTASSKPDTAMQVPTVWACVNLLAGSVSSLPLETFRRTARPDAGVPQRITDPQVVTTPDSGVTQSSWLHTLMVSLLLRGNAFGRIMARDSLGHPTSVHLLNPDYVQVKLGADGRLQYTLNAPGGGQKPVPAEDMWHLPGLTLPGSLVGLSPISYAAATIGLDLSSRDFANGFFDGGGIPKAVLESDQFVNQEQARGLKDRIMASFRQREPVVMGLGLKYVQIQVKPEESQFLATQQANATQICRFFGVPAAMVDAPAGNSMNYSNTEMRGIEFLTYSLAHWLKRIEDGMFALLPGQQYVKFDTRSLLRLDAHTQSQVDLLDVAAKVVVPSEIRQRRGLPPMTDEQKQEAEMVPLTISPLGRPTAAGTQGTNPLDAAPVPPADQGAIEGNPN